jgi:hypothetical protein
MLAQGQDGAGNDDVLTEHPARRSIAKPGAVSPRGGAPSPETKKGAAVAVRTEKRMRRFLKGSLVRSTRLDRR